MTSEGEIGLIGAGAVARSLGHALVQCGYRVSTVISPRNAASLAASLGAKIDSDRLSDLPTSASIVFACVPDDAIESVAHELAGRGNEWRARWVAHMSGARTVRELQPLAARGALTCSFHPLLSFPRHGAVRSFRDVYIGLEGTDEAVAVAEGIVRALEARAVRVPSASKVRYHLAATIASNYLVALFGIVDEILGDREGDEALSSRIYLPLVRHTLDALQEVGPELALTGPVARGDEGTIQSHLEELAATLPHMVPVYVALATEAIRLAVRGGQITSEVATQLLDLADQYVTTVGTGTERV